MKNILDWIEENKQQFEDPEPRITVAQLDNVNTPDLEQSEFLEPKRIDIFGNVIPAETLEDWDTTFRRPNAEGGVQQLVTPSVDGSRPGYQGKDKFISGTGTGVKGIDDPKKYKIVKKYLNKVKSQKNKRIFLDWSEQIGNKKTKWYTDLSKEVKLSRDPLNKLINKVTLEEFPTAYAGKTGRVNYAREMVVKTFIDYWNQNGAFDGNEKLSKILKQFQKDSVDKKFENINRYFMDWKDGKFEVPGVDRKNLDKNLLKDIKNYRPNAKDVRSLTVAKQLKYLDGLSPNLSFNQVEKLFAKQFPDNAQTLQHRLNQLTQLKRNGAYNTGAGNVAKIATIKIGDRPKWLIEGYGKGFTGNYGNLIKKADDLLAAGDKVNAERLYKAADKFFGPNGIFTKAAGEGEHPLSRNMGDGPIGNQLKINSLVSGDLNQFKKFNFDSPVRNAVLEYNNPKTTDARRAELKIEIENRKKLMNILTEGPNQKGIVEPVKFNYGSKTLTESVDVVDIDKVKNFDINEYITRGDDYRKSFVAQGEKLGLIDKSGNIIKQKLNIDLSIPEGRLKFRQIGTAKVLNKILENNKIKICNDELQGGKGVVCGTKFAERDPNGFMEAIKRNKDAVKIINKPGLVKGALKGVSAWAKKELGPMGWIGSIATIDSAFGLHALGQGKTPLQALDTTLWFLPKSVLKADEKMFKDVYERAGYTKEDFGEFQKWRELEDLDRQYFNSQTQLEFMKDQVFEGPQTELEKGLRKEMDLQKDSPYAMMGWNRPLFAITSEEEKTGEHPFYGPAVDRYNKIIDRSEKVYGSLKDPEKSWKDLDYTRKLAAMEQANRKKKLMRESLRYNPAIIPMFDPFSKFGPKEMKDQSFLYDEYVHPLYGPSVSPEQIAAVDEGRFRADLYSDGGRAGYMGGGITAIRKPHAIPPERQGLRSIMINGKKS